MAKTDKTAAESVQEQEIPSISEKLGQDGANFYPELPREDWKSLIDSEIVIMDAKIMALKSKLRGAKSGEIHDCALIKARKVSGGDSFTTITSGEVIVNKVKKLIADNLFPIRATVLKPKNYYNLG